MTTLKDLGRRLNLSVTQVSRALNGYSDVSEATRQRVLNAAKTMKYHPNSAARKLVSGRSGIVGLVLTGLPQHPTDSLFVQIVGGLSSHFARNGMQFVLHIADPGDDIVEVYRRLVYSGSLDGFVVLEPLCHDPRLAFLREQGVPFVLHGRDGVNDFPFFDIDNHGVAHTLTRYLTDRGHRRIAFLNGTADRTYCVARDAGYRRALDQAGLAFDPALLFHAAMEEGYGTVATVRLFDGRRPPPTAIIAGNAWIAKGILHALAALGQSVPRDVSVVAHDDLLPSAPTPKMDPPLTVTESALELSWAPLAEILVGAVQGQALETLQRLGDFRLIERDSVRAL